MQDINIYENSYLIIGAPNTMKSEISMLLKQELNYKLINLDREKHSYFNDFTDYDSNIYYDLLDKSYNKALNYIHQYEMKHLNYVLESIKENVIMDFGNTYLLIDDINIINKIKLFKNIVLLHKNEDKIEDFEYKLKNNKILEDIHTIKICIDNKNKSDIIKEILRFKDFKSIL